MTEEARLIPGLKRAARPRDAATLIIVQRNGSQPRILMGQRSGGHDFMPDKWVFPGGRIHPADFRVPAASEMRPDTLAAVCEGTTPERARALAMTAIRETFEETGLVLGEPASPYRSRGEWQAFLKGHRPTLAGLTYIARAITPPARHKRFDARFFMADADGLTSLTPQSNGELDRLAWFTLEECRALDLPTVTRLVIDVIQNHLEGGSPQRPFWRWTRNNPDSAR